MIFCPRYLALAVFPKISILILSTSISFAFILSWLLSIFVLSGWIPRPTASVLILNSQSISRSFTHDVEKSNTSSANLRFVRQSSVASLSLMPFRFSCHFFRSFCNEYCSTVLNSKEDSGSPCFVLSFDWKYVALFVSQNCSLLLDGKTKKPAKNNKNSKILQISFNSKDSKKFFFFKSEQNTKSKDTHNAAAREENTRKSERKEAEAVQGETMDIPKADVEGSKGSSSSNDSPPIQEEMRQDTTTFTVLQKNTRSMNSSERLEELFREIHRVRWDVILISETRRQGKEIWETQQGHIVIESGKFTNKHGVAILLNRRWKNQINWGQCACERVVAASITVNKQPIILVSAYLPHSGYPDHQVQRTYKTITTAIEKDKSMKIIGGDFNAELGPGGGIELSSVGHYTLNKANCRGEWMMQWLLENNLCRVKLDVQEITAKTGDLPHSERC